MQGRSNSFQDDLNRGPPALPPQTLPLLPPGPPQVPQIKKTQVKRSLSSPARCRGPPILSHPPRGPRQATLPLPFNHYATLPPPTTYSDTATQTSPNRITMKLRGSGKISRTKAVPFLILAIFLLLLGLVLAAEGLLIDFMWGYSLRVFYRPYWLGTLVILAGCFILLFSCLRTPAVAVVVATVCLLALAGSIIMLVFSTLMTEALIPDNEKYFCASQAVDNNTLFCVCEQDIEFNVTVKGTASNATVNDSCEDEVAFIFDLMLVTAAVSALLVILLFVYISWVYCAATRITYTERRMSAFNGTMTRTGTILRAQQGAGTLIIGNTSRPRTSSRAQSVNSGGFRPVVTVQSTPSPRSGTVQNTPSPGTPQSRTGTLKSTKAPAPPRASPQEPVYNNIEQDPIRDAEQHRFEIPVDIHGQKGEESLPSSPPDIPEPIDDNSSEDNTAVSTHSFRKSPPKGYIGVGGKIQNFEKNLNIQDYGKA